MVEFKRDFGSFHSSNIEEIIQADDSVYKTPEHSVKFELNQYLLYDMTMMFGSKQLKKSLFFLDDEFNFLNHGAFGLSFKPVMQYTNEWRNYAESQPLRFYDRQIIPLLGDLIRLYSKQVFDCRAEELVLVENCTFAFNSILNSIELNGNDKILIFNTTYGVYKKILKNKCRQNGADLIEIEINFPLLNTKDFNEQIIEPFCAVLEKEKSIKYIFVDHIPSNQPFLMPISQLSEICKLKNPEIIFICDAAHSLGSVKDFSLKKLNNVDLAFMNCHKWLDFVLFVYSLFTQYLKFFLKVLWTKRYSVFVQEHFDQICFKTSCSISWHQQWVSFRIHMDRIKRLFVLFRFICYS